jgi:hypothetical protein
MNTGSAAPRLAAASQLLQTPSCTTSRTTEQVTCTLLGCAVLLLLME